MLTLQNLIQAIEKATFVEDLGFMTADDGWDSNTKNLIDADILLAELRGMEEELSDIIERIGRMVEEDDT